MLDWIHLSLLGPRTSLLALIAKVPTQEVFTCSAPIHDDILEAPPLHLRLGRRVASALLLHWRVQAYLVGYLDSDSRQEYRGLLPGLRINGWPLWAFTMNRGPLSQAWRVVVAGTLTLAAPLPYLT